jgi:hypothetical protein
MPNSSSVNVAKEATFFLTVKYSPLSNTSIGSANLFFYGKIFYAPVEAVTYMASIYSQCFSRVQSGSWVLKI